VPSVAYRDSSATVVRKGGIARVIAALHHESPSRREVMSRETSGSCVSLFMEAPAALDGSSRDSVKSNDKTFLATRAATDGFVAVAPRRLFRQQES
jgi:hypothetical protein